jgi:hypothetical protein
MDIPKNLAKMKENLEYVTMARVKKLHMLLNLGHRNFDYNQSYL